MLNKIKNFVTEAIKVSPLGVLTIICLIQLSIALTVLVTIQVSTLYL